MLNWLFDSTKSDQKVKVDSKVDNSWAFEYVGQYLNSPLWRTPVLDFLENNCVIFEDSEENLFEYTTVFESFKKLVSKLIDSMMEQVGISEQLLEECIVKGLKTKRRRLFQQLLVCDNFQAFKRVMIKKNKEFEMEAIIQLAKSDPAFKNLDQKSRMALQRMEIEKAISLSEAVLSKLDEEEEKMIQAAIKESQVDQLKRQQALKKGSHKTEYKGQYDKLPLIQPTIKPIPFGSPLQDGNSIESLKRDRDELIQQSAKIPKSVQEVEDSSNRKKRLVQQRQLLRNKKQEERKQQLQHFLEGKQTQKPKEEEEEPKVTAEELERRRNLVKKFKNQLSQ